MDRPTNGWTVGWMDGDLHRQIRCSSPTRANTSHPRSPTSLQELREGRELLLSTRERVGVYRRLAAHMRDHFGSDDMGKRKSFYFFPWHFNFFVRWAGCGGWARAGQRAGQRAAATSSRAAWRVLHALRCAAPCALCPLRATAGRRLSLPPGPHPPTLQGPPPAAPRVRRAEPRVATHLHAQEHLGPADRRERGGWAAPRPASPCLALTCL